MEFAQEGDLKRAYGDCVVEYEGKIQYAQAIGQNYLRLNEFAADGGMTNNFTEVNMEVRPLLKTPTLGFFIYQEHQELCLMTKAIRRQFTFGLSLTNSVAKIVRLSDDRNDLDPVLIKVGGMRFSQYFIKQFFTRNKTLLDWKGEQTLVLTPNFAVLSEKLLHIDGVIGSVDRKVRRVLFENRRLDDSLMREKVRKLGFEL